MRDQRFIRENLPASLTQLNQTDDKCAAALDACGITGELADRIRAVWAASDDEHQLIVSLGQDPLTNLSRAAIFCAKRIEIHGANDPTPYLPLPVDYDAEKTVIAALARIPAQAQKQTENLLPEDFGSDYYAGFFGKLRSGPVVDLHFDHENHPEETEALTAAIRDGVGAEHLTQATTRMLDLANRRRLMIALHGVSALAQSPFSTMLDCSSLLFEMWRNIYAHCVIPEAPKLTDAVLSVAVKKAESEAFDA